MDPYLEADMWPDVHHTLATYIREALSPQLVPKYVAKVEPRLVKDHSPEQDIGILYPDVAALEKRPPAESPTFSKPAKETTPATLSLPLIAEAEFELPTVHIYDRQQQRLITAVEILSPINKREPQLSEYRQKRRELRQAQVHLLEIDLIRRGKTPFQHPQLPESDYRVILERANQTRSEIWTLDLADPLPVLPVPLAESDADVSFDLGQILKDLYARSYYRQALNYQQDPPPPGLSPEKMAWVREQVENR